MQSFCEGESGNDSFKALSLILEAWDEGTDQGIAPELMAYAALFTALTDLVAAFGEDAEERARRQWDNAGDWHHADSKHVKLSAANLSHAISVRRSRCTHENGQYSQPIFMKMFGSLKLVLVSLWPWSEQTLSVNH